MAKINDIERLNSIVVGVSELPVENQEYILATIKGMLFTRKLLMNQVEESNESLDS